MTCPNCGTENPTGTKFCKECGHELALTCSSCGKPLSPDAKFCGECGTPVAVDAAEKALTPKAPAKPEPAVERRLVSVLFADLVGFTPYSEARDAEEVRDTLDRYFEIARDAIERHGGTVEKFIGDAVMAVWGAPVAREDDAERAVRAALELVDAVTPLGVTARAGVLTGEAAVNVGAVGEGMVVGDIVNTAARLQSVAAPGTVLVGESTYRAASRAIAFEPAGEHALKGKATPVAAWKALRVIAERGDKGGTDLPEAPFVGRDEELRLLKDLLAAVGRDRKARLVSVTGPGGIGKSRLASELEKYVVGLVEPVFWLSGRSPAYGEGITFWALGEMIRRLAGLAETDDEPTTRARITAMVADHVLDQDERSWIERALLTLLGIDAGVVGSDQLFAAWRTFFERLAAKGVVVMAFEDLHWADPGLLDFIDQLLGWSRSLPIYVLTLARPELLERRPNWAAGKRSFTSLFLDPLSVDAMHELLTGLAPGIPESALVAIVARADGIPLYAVETVRMLLGKGQLSLIDGVYGPAGDFTSFAVPESLTALIGARLDGLDPTDRALLQDAAVLGQSFTPAGLAAVSGIDVPSLEPRLQSLTRRELLTLQTDPRSPERGQYAFVQALIREVAYNTLAKRDRKARHLAAARFFESLSTDEIAGGLAGHYLAALRNAPEGAEADAVAAQARIALRAAAERATALGSHDQAVGFFNQALEVTTEPPETAELLERAGESASAAGRHEAAEAYLRRAIDAQRDLGNRPAVARAVTALGNALLHAYRSPEALALLEPAATEFADLRVDRSVIALGGQLARAYFLGDDDRRAIEVVDPVLEAAEHADLGPVIADALVTRGSALISLGRPIEGLGILRAAQELAEAIGLGATLLRAYTNRSFLQSKLDPLQALGVGQAGMLAARRLGRRSDFAALLRNAAEVAFRTGDWPWAVGELEAALAEEFEAPDRARLLQPAIFFRSVMGEPVSDRLNEIRRLTGDSDDPVKLAPLAKAEAFAAFGTGRLDEARATWRRVAILSLDNLPDSMPRAARASLWLGDIAGAADDLKALEGSRMHGPAIEADRLTIRAGLAALDDRAADALPLYRDALRAWRDLGLIWDEALCGLDMTTLLDASEPAVRDAAQSAREIFARLQATPFIVRLDAAASSAAPAPSASAR